MKKNYWPVIIKVIYFEIKQRLIQRKETTIYRWPWYNNWMLLHNPSSHKKHCLALWSSPLPCINKVDCVKGNFSNVLLLRYHNTQSTHSQQQHGPDWESLENCCWPHLAKHRKSLTAGQRLFQSNDYFARHIGRRARNIWHHPAGPWHDCFWKSFVFHIMPRKVGKRCCYWPTCNILKIAQAFKKTYYPPEQVLQNTK